jgi:hypothetical protein
MREFALLGREEYRAPVAVSQQFRNANNSIGGPASTSCENREPGNPYDEQTDYQGWSAWRASGAWDMVVNTNFRATKPGEKRLRLIGAGFIGRIRLRMIDSLR